MCVRAHICMKGIQGACLSFVRAELVQRLSFGLLIPFYSSGIMCYSNPNPIWGVWRWHEDDVVAGTRGDTEKNHRPTQSQLSTRDRLRLAARWNDFTGSLCPQQIIAAGRKSILTVENMHFTAHSETSWTLKSIFVT